MSLDLTVGWGRSVGEDLRAAGVSKAVARRLVIIAETTLRIPVDPTDPDEGYLEKGYFWRRGVPRHDTQEEPASDEEGEDPPAKDLILLYRPADGREKTHGYRYVVEEVWTAGRLAEYTKPLAAIIASHDSRPDGGQGWQGWLDALRRFFTRS